MEIKNLEPRIFWEIFDAITKVPRPSKKEGKIRYFGFSFHASVDNLLKMLDAYGVTTGTMVGRMATVQVPVKRYPP